MLRRIVWGLAIVVAGLIGVLAVTLLMPRTCYACSVATPPPPCTINLSAMTVKQGDARRAWWQFLDRRDDNTLNLYFGLNNNSASGSANYAYQIAGTWDNGDTVVVTPTLVMGSLDPSGSSNANQTHALHVTYEPTRTGTFSLQALRTDGGGACVAPESASTEVRVNGAGPTVWPITPRSCPVAGEKPRLNFGIHNPADTPQTYNVVARANNPFNGETINIQGKGSVANLGPITIAPGETREVKIDCETFGYCLTGSENQVQLELTPAAGGDPFTALASSNVTLRDPSATCPRFEDWWFVMPPLVLTTLIGVPTGAGVISGVVAYLRRRPPPRPMQPPPGLRSSPPSTGNPVTKKTTASSTGDLTHGRSNEPPKKGPPPKR